MIKDVFSKDRQKKAAFHAFAGSEDSSSNGDDKYSGQQKRRKMADDFQDSELSDDQHYRMTELLDNVDGRNGAARAPLLLESEGSCCEAPVSKAPLRPNAHRGAP